MAPRILAFFDPWPKRLPALVIKMPSSRRCTLIEPTSRESTAIVLLSPFEYPG
jgi:hypothetical protein